MSDTFVLSGLIRKRAEISGQIEGARRFIADATAQLAALDQTLILFGYDLPQEIQPIIKIPVNLFGSNELKRLLLDIQRDCPELISNRLVAMEVIRRKEWDTSNAALVVSIIARVKGARKRMKMVEARQRRLPTGASQA
jgi:hypothetical protein